MTPLPRFFPALAAALALAGSVAAPRAAEFGFDAALAKVPPPVASASLEPLAKPGAEGNTILRVRFADKTGRAFVPIQGPRGAVALRDDGIAPDDKAGDGLFAALVQVDTNAFAAEQRRRAELARRFSTVPRFTLRELTGTVPFRPSPGDLKPGVRTPLDDFRGVPLIIDSERELLVRDVLVVDDPARTYNPCTGIGTPMGAWTFGRLMTEIANQPVTGIDPSDLVENWIAQWKVDLTINGLTAQNRAIGAQALLDAWPKLGSGKLDLAQAPFRLLAIVNRQDLRGNQLYGGSGDAGEARLVFGLLHCQHVQGDHFPPGEKQDMTVIFEYGVPKSGCPQVRDWAQQWHALGTLVLGSAPYNAALQAITDQFTLRDANPAKPPNRSAINQVRTNEISLSTFVSDSFWQLRESKLVPKGTSAGQLRHMTVAQTPDRPFNDSPALRDYINANTLAINAGNHLVPLTWPVAGGPPFRAAFSEPGAGFGWNAAGIVDLTARHRFSLATCSGCHKGEGVANFLHIGTRNTGAASALSNFLTGAGMPVTDGVSGVNRWFHELLDRQMKLDATSSMICFKAGDLPVSELFFVPLPAGFPH